MDDRASPKNVRNVMEIAGKAGLMAQGANGELLVSLQFSELSFTLPTTVTTLPNVTVASMPNLTIASVPSLTIGSVPSLTANPTKPTILAQGLLSTSDAVLHTTAAAYRELEIRFTNVDTSARTYTFAVGATAPGVIDDTHTLGKTSPLPVGYAAREQMPGIATSTQILGKCDSASKVAYTIWGTA